jgi:hypothetical protein
LKRTEEMMERRLRWKEEGVSARR